MIITLLAARPYLETSYENFTDAREQQKAVVSAFTIFFIIIFSLISAYGAARLSYFYNMNTGNSGWALFWSILAFLFADIYYPMYSYFLNPLSAKTRNNIVVPGV
jgi:hypothetical protein